MVGDVHKGYFQRRMITPVLIKKKPEKSPKKARKKPWKKPGKSPDFGVFRNGAKSTKNRPSKKNIAI